MALRQVCLEDRSIDNMRVAAIDVRPKEYAAGVIFEDHEPAAAGTLINVNVLWLVFYEKGRSRPRVMRSHVCEFRGEWVARRQSCREVHDYRFEASEAALLVHVICRGIGTLGRLLTQLRDQRVNSQKGRLQRSLVRISKLIFVGQDVFYL